MRGAVRPVFATKARNQLPRSSRNWTGDVEELLTAFGSSLPRGERPTPQTKLPLFTAFSASYDATSARPQISADTFAPAVSHCGLMNSGWLHSFMTTNWCTLGNERATRAVH